MKKMLLIKVFILYICLILCITSACQPTPERNAIVHVGDFLQSIEGTPAPQASYIDPESWNETLNLKNGDKKIEISAVINVPDVTAFPVYKVEKTEFEDARIKLLVNYFTKGKEVIRNSEPTKAEWTKRLIIAKKNNDEEMVADIEKEIESAPETVEPEVITAWYAGRSPAGKFLTDNGEYAEISVRKNVFIYINGFVETEYVRELNDEGKIGDLAITEEYAITAALNMLHELGIDHMTVGSVEKAQRYVCYSNSALPVFSEKPVSKGYLIKFARNIDGIAGIGNNVFYYNIKDDFAYTAPLYPEEIQVYFDESGIAQSFTWSYPLTIKEIVTENAALLPFEDMKQRIRDMLKFINSYSSEPKKVTKINLNMAIVSVKDHPEEAMYVPAWFIYYTETYGNIRQEYTLALNAVDGGRISEYPVDIDPETQKLMDADK